MSPLWSNKSILHLSKKLSEKPSPTYRFISPGSARDLEPSLAGGGSLLSGVSSFIKGTSLPASFSGCKAFFMRRTQAGMTVEAAIVLPLFLFFFLNIGCAIEMIRLHGNLQLALWQTGSRLAVYGYAVDGAEIFGEENEGKEGEEWWSELSGIVFASTYVKAKVIDLAGRDYLESSPLKKGADSLQLWESQVFGPGDEIDLVVTYAVTPWSSLAGFFGFRMANRYYAHIWNGYELPAESKGVQMVFMTENGSVYHLDRNCTYLQLSVQRVSASEVKWMKNLYGKSYQACEKCVGEVSAAVRYITFQGDCYHYTRACPGLTRTVYAVSLEEAVATCERCSRCGKKHEGTA